MAATHPPCPTRLRPPVIVTPSHANPSNRRFLAPKRSAAAPNTGAISATASPVAPLASPSQNVLSLAAMRAAQCCLK